MKSAKYLLVIFIALCCVFIAYYLKASDASTPKITLITKEISLVKFGQGKPIRADATVSPDNRRIAYKESVGTSGRCVVVNGVPGKLYDRKYFTLISCVFSPDSKHLAYPTGTKDNKNFVVLDGVEGPGGYTGIGYPVFSPDSSQLAYEAMR